METVKELPKTFRTSKILNYQPILDKLKDGVWIALTINVLLLEGEEVTEFKKHRGRHKWEKDDVGMESCVKCGKPRPESVIPPEPKVE